MRDVHRMHRHIAAWRNVTAPVIIAEGRLRVPPRVADDAIRRMQTETYDAILLSFGHGVWGTDSFAAPDGTLAYAIGPSGAKRLLANALPVEQHIDAFLLTLSQLRIAAIDQHPSAVRLSSFAVRSQRFLRPEGFFFKNPAVPAITFEPFCRTFR